MSNEIGYLWSTLIKLACVRCTGFKTDCISVMLVMELQKIYNCKSKSVSNIQLINSDVCVSHFGDEIYCVRCIGDKIDYARPCRS